MSSPVVPLPTGAAAPPRFRLGNRPALDGLRGLAVVSVIASHLHLIPGGFVGVEALFALSGFLITALLIEERERRGSISLGGFYRKRFLRILPPLVAVLVIGCTVNVASGRATLGYSLAEAVTALAFVANFGNYHQTPMPTFGHTWTLALEVQFYLVWPVALWFLLRSGVGLRWVIAVTGAAIAASAALKVVLFLQRPPNGPAQYAYLMRMFFYPDAQGDVLLIGCLTGLLVAGRYVPDAPGFRARLRVFGWLSMAGLAYPLLKFTQANHAVYCGGLTLIALMVCTLVVCLITDPPRPLAWVLEGRPLVGLGRISYALYLFHMPFCVWLDPHTHGAMALVVVLSVACAVLSFYLIERPFIRGRRLPVPEARPVEPAPADAEVRRAA